LVPQVDSVLPEGLDRLVELELLVKLELRVLMEYVEILDLLDQLVK